MPQNFEDLKGKVVKDINNNLYVVHKDIFNAFTDKRMILYTSFYDENEFFVLSKSLFLAEVDKDKYLNSKQEFSFQLVDKTLPLHSLNKNTPKIKPIIRNSINFNKKIVQVFSGNFYFVIDLAHDSQTGEAMVLYHPIDNKNLIMTVPQRIFLGKIDLKKNPNSKQKYLYEIVDSNIALHLFPNQKDLISLKGRVIRRFNNLYYIVIDLPHDPITDTDFVLMKGLFGKYDLKLLPRSYFLSELESKRSSKYKEKYIYNLVEPDKVPSKPSLYNWFIKERSVRFQYNLYWGSILIISYVFLFVFLLLKS